MSPRLRKAINNETRNRKQAARSGESKRLGSFIETALNVKEGPEVVFKCQSRGREATLARASKWASY